jgi:hypothetical protein
MTRRKTWLRWLKLKVQFYLWTLERLDSLSQRIDLVDPARGYYKLYTPPGFELSQRWVSHVSQQLDKVLSELTERCKP